MELKKTYYTIGEVSKLIGVQQHVLRNWEKEIGFLKPKKKDSGHRLYTKKDVEIVFRIKELLYDELYTIKGAKKRLWHELKRKKQPDPEIIIARLKKQLKDLMKTINSSKVKSS
jgi:DNA-binding transcriptional MerR regulator